MSIDLLRRSCLFILLCLAQMLVFNRIQLFGCAIPLLYSYYVITFRRNTPQWVALPASFLMGLLIDMSANTPGIACTSLTLLAFVQPYILNLFMTSDDDENMFVSAKTMEWNKFLTYSFFMVAIYCIVFFTVEAFNFSNWQYWLLNIVGSIPLTWILIATLEIAKK